MTSWRERLRMLVLSVFAEEKYISKGNHEEASRHFYEREKLLNALAAEIEAAVAVAEADYEVERVRALTSADIPKPGTAAWQERISKALEARDIARATYRRLRDERP